MRILVLSGLLLATTAFHTPNDWLTLPQALSRAQQEQLPVLVYVNASWCGPCKAMERDVFPGAKPLLDRMVLAKLNYDDHETQWPIAGKQLTAFEWSRHLGIEATPGFVLLDDQGEVITHFTGYLDETRFNLLLAFVITSAYRHDTFDAFAKQAKL